ncbi:MAG: S23 ribosomal [uncultured bacterium]|nr:MAG: S23 ribosomal [uncultured bacterium]
MVKPIKNFQDLEIYQLSVNLALDVYRFCDKIPQKEKYNIIDQLIRATSSIGANIAEGFGRYHKKEFIQYLYISRGSLMEVLHFLILSNRLGYLENNELSKFDDKIVTLGVKINNLINAINNHK